MSPHALYFMDDEKSFFEAVAYLRQVNQLETTAFSTRPKMVADAAAEEEATRTIPRPHPPPQA
jgi:hypothetical protein